MAVRAVLLRCTACSDLCWQQVPYVAAMGKLALPQMSCVFLHQRSYERRWMPGEFTSTSRSI